MNAAYQQYTPCRYPLQTAYHRWHQHLPARVTAAEYVHEHTPHIHKLVDGGAGEHICTIALVLLELLELVLLVLLVLLLVLVLLVL